MRKTVKALILAGTAAVCGTVLFLIYKQVIKLNTPSEEEYPVRGIDVSSYQGEIDWNVLSRGQDFAYIKATEGSTFADERFAYNWEHSRETPLRVGAYHFFSFDSGGAAQAENFIGNVKGFDGMLPPVIDVELYGDHRRDPKPAEEVVPELREMVGRLEAEYGMKPIFYATGSGYRLYVRDNFPDCGLWIRDVYTRPSEDSGWVFWQYSGTDVLDGYNGEEKYIDRNVFRGTRKEFEDFCAKSSS